MYKSLLHLSLFVFILQACNDKPEVLPLNNELSLLAYPNPFSDLLNISASVQANTDAQILLFNTKGEIIFEAVLEQQQQTFLIDLQNEPSGTYQVIIQSNDLQTIQKVIKL